MKMKMKNCDIKIEIGVFWKDNILGIFETTRKIRVLIHNNTDSKVHLDKLYLSFKTNYIIFKTSIDIEIPHKFIFDPLASLLADPNELAPYILQALIFVKARTAFESTPIFAERIPQIMTDVVWRSPNESS